MTDLHPRPLRQRFDHNIKVHYDLSDLRPTMKLQYRRMLLVVVKVWDASFQAWVLIENGKLPDQTSVRQFDTRQLAEMRRPARWILRQLDQTLSHEPAE